MTRRKKQVFGMVGLAFVLAMTAIAYALPTNDAAAAEYVAEGTPITVTVTDPADAPYVNIQSLNGDGVAPVGDSYKVTSNQFSAATDYYKVSEITYGLSCTASDGSKVEKDIETYKPADQRGSKTISVDMNVMGDDLGDATCVLTARAEGTAGDSVSFEYYRALAVTISDEKDASGNPIAHIVFNSSVDHMTAQVFDEKGNLVFDALQITNQMINGKTSYDLALPMSQNSAKAGNYTLVVTAFDKDGNTISVNTNDFKYDPKTPGVPSTGAVMGDLNISRMDYILTGLIAFGAVAAFAVFLMVRKHRKM